MAMFALNIQLQARFNKAKVCYKVYNVLLCCDHLCKCAIMNNDSTTYAVKHSNNMDLFLNTAQCKTGECCKRAALEEH